MYKKSVIHFYTKLLKFLNETNHADKKVTTNILFLLGYLYLNALWPNHPTYPLKGQTILLPWEGARVDIWHFSRCHQKWKCCGGWTVFSLVLWMENPILNLALCYIWFEWEFRKIFTSGFSQSPLPSTDRTSPREEDQG